MENEVDWYVMTGAYVRDIQKRANLRNEDICKGVNIGHTTFNLGRGLRIGGNNTLWLSYEL